MTTNKTSETSDNGDKGNGKCPPGMKPGPDGKCIPAGEAFKTEEDNAGATSDKGAPTNVDASTKDNPSDTHECGEGFTWDGEQCVPSGDSAGAGGGGGTGDPSTPGKEAMEWFYKQNELLMASHTDYSTKQLLAFEKRQDELLKAFLATSGKPVYKAESVSFGVKNESSMVNDTGKDSVYEKTVRNPAAFFEAAAGRSKVTLQEGFTTWNIKPMAFYETLKKGWLNYTMQHSTQGTTEQVVKSETFTISAGDMPQIFSKQVYLVPGGRMRVPIRQFLDTQIIEDSDRFNWYTVNGFAFDDVTNEGSEPTTEESQTITKVTATPALVRANQTVNYADIENAPFDLIEAFNRAAALGALDAEATDVLDTVYDAITPTNWINGNTGDTITEDDTTAPTTLAQEGLYGGMREIQNQGGDTSPGNMVAFLHPKALTELILDITSDFWSGNGPTGGPPLMNTAMGVVENRLGMDIVATNAVAAQDNTTNDTYRNVLMMKGSIGLAVAADLQIEAQRRPDLSAVKVGARHRIKGAVIDETMTARISTAQ